MEAREARRLLAEGRPARLLVRLGVNGPINRAHPVSRPQALRLLRGLKPTDEIKVHQDAGGALFLG